MKNKKPAKGTKIRKLLDAKDTVFVVSASGGKDSGAVALTLLEWDVPFILAFADTGNEHETTLEYVNDLPSKLGISPLITVKADYTERIAKKRKFIANDSRDPLLSGRKAGWSQEAKERALLVLDPSGNPFLDMCMCKGRFPSRKGQFCTQELKQLPIYHNIQEPLLDEGKQVISVQGIRREESPNRKGRQMIEPDIVFGSDHLITFLPILHWSTEDVFAMHRRHGLKPNPLYKQGFSRVGCMPCINSSKSDIYEIFCRFPHHIERIRKWEHIVSLSSKRQLSTFFAADTTPFKKIASIDDVVSWSKTGFGGRQFDLLKTLPVPTCSSVYGLCE